MRKLKTYLACGLLVALASLALGQDIVTYADRVTKKDAEFRGTIEEEGPAGIKIKVKDGKEFITKTIPARDIVQVQYASKEVDKVSYRQPFGKEERARTATSVKNRTAFLREALDGFTSLRDKLGDRPQAKRYVEFKAAEVKVLLARDDPSMTDDAIKALAAFKSNHPSCWQILSAGKLLARLLEENGRVEEARKAYEDLAELPDAPPDLRQESGILVGKLLLRSGKFAEAQKRLDKLASTMSREDLQMPFVRAYILESKLGQDNTEGLDKELADVIASTADPRARGLAYNLTGDFYRKKGQLADAFWAYLRVDAQYNEDAEEQARALYHLGSLFDKVKKDPLRGKECLRELSENPRFAGTGYHKLAAKEAKQP